MSSKDENYNRNPDGKGGGLKPDNPVTGPMGDGAKRLVLVIG